MGLSDSTKPDRVFSIPPAGVRLAGAHIRKWQSRETPLSIGGFQWHRTFGAHMSYQEIELLIFPYSGLRPRSVMTVVRNPFTRALSLFGHWQRLTRATTAQEVANFLSNFLAGPYSSHSHFAHARTQSSFLRTLDGAVLTCDILRFESLSEDFARWHANCCRQDASIATRQPTSSRFAYLLLDPELQSLITRHYSEDFDQFGYARQFLGEKCL